MSIEKQALRQFEEWLELLDRTNHIELLDQPINVWLEAYCVGAMFERMRISLVAQTALQPPKMPDDFEGDTAMADQLYEKMRKQILAIVHQVPVEGMASGPRVAQ